MKLETKFEGMTCLDCARNLEKALLSVPGVEGAEVSYPGKRGTVVASADVQEVAAAMVYHVFPAGSDAVQMACSCARRPRRSPVQPVVEVT